MSGYVYIISDGSAVKVGITKNRPERRLAQLQTGNPRTLLLVFCERTLFAEETEKAAHRRLAPYQRVGEWFSVGERTADAVVRATMAALEQYNGKVPIRPVP